MYTCDKHGKLETCWCEKCQKTVQCDCSNIITTKIKDIVYNCEKEVKILTAHIKQCKTCGKIFNIKLTEKGV